MRPPQVVAARQNLDISQTGFQLEELQLKNLISRTGVGDPLLASTTAPVTWTCDPAGSPAANSPGRELCASVIALPSRTTSPVAGV